MTYPELKELMVAEGYTSSSMTEVEINLGYSELGLTQHDPSKSVFNKLLDMVDCKQLVKQAKGVSHVLVNSIIATIVNKYLPYKLDASEIELAWVYPYGTGRFMHISLTKDAKYNYSYFQNVCIHVQEGLKKDTRNVWEVNVFPQSNWYTAIYEGDTLVNISSYPPVAFEDKTCKQFEECYKCK